MDSYLPLEEYETNLAISDLPDDIKIEIFKYVANVRDFNVLSQVCKEWCNLMTEECLWKILFLQDYGSWYWSERSSDNSERSKKQIRSIISWRERFKDYHTRGWQWDLYKKHQNVELLNNNFTASLLEGENYHGVRVTQGLTSGIHYFEVIVEIPQALSEEERFDRGTEIFLSIGVANDKFNVEECGSGWALANSGIGYYNDGSVYALGEQVTPRKRVKIRTGDRFGISIDMSSDLHTVKFYINSEPVTEDIMGLSGAIIYPHMILAGNTKCHVTVLSCNRKFPRHVLSDKQLAYRSFVTGKELYDAKNYNDCIPHFDKALSWNSNWKTGLKWRAKAFHKLESWTSAIQDFTKLIELDPDNASSWIARGVVYEALTKTDSSSNEKALSDYSKAIALDPNNSTAYNNRAIIRENLRFFSDALEDYTKAIHYKPNCPIAYKNRADLYETMGDYDKALIDYGSALEQDNRYTPAYNDRGCLYKKLGKLDQALADYDKAVELTGKYYHYSNRAHVKEMLGKYTEALEDYTIAIKLEANNRLAYNNRSSLWNLFREYNKAIDDSNKTISLAPSQANPYSHRAFALCETGKLEEALSDVNKSIELNDQYPRAYCYRAYILYKMGKLDEAIDDTAKCISIHPEEIPDVYYVRGLIMRQMGLIESSVEELKRCITIRYKVRVFTVEKIEKELECV